MHLIGLLVSGKIIRVGRSMLRLFPDIMTQKIDKCLKFEKPIDGNFDVDYVSIRNRSTFLDSFLLDSLLSETL